MCVRKKDGFVEEGSCFFGDCRWESTEQMSHFGEHDLAEEAVGEVGVQVGV